MNREGFALIHIESPIAGDLLRPGSLVHGRGWIVADRQVVGVAIYLGDFLLTYARYGLPRPEIEGKFPHYHSRDPGFSFSAKVQGFHVEGASDLSLRVRVDLVGGIARERSVLLSTASGTTAGRPQDVLRSRRSEEQPTKIFVDYARIDQQGFARIRGWAVAPKPITLRLYLGDELLGQPETGKPRPDVLASYSQYANAEFSGFELIQDVGGLSSSPGFFRISAQAEGDAPSQLIFPIDRGTSDRLFKDESASIDFCCEALTVDEDGLVRAEGWAVGGDGIREIALALDGEPIGIADLGTARPDVGNRYPANPKARSSGYVFARRAEKSLRGDCIITFTILSLAGPEKQISLTVHVKPSAMINGSVAELRWDAHDIWLEIDRPQIVGGRAAVSPFETLIVSGWAVALDEIDSVSIQMGDGEPLPAYIGTRREDVAANFPEVSRSLFSGFAATVPHEAIGDGEHEMRVTVVTKSGYTRERRIAVLSTSAGEAADQTLKTRLTPSMVDMWLSIVRSLAHRPLFQIVVDVSAWRLDLLNQLTLTLQSICRQAYPDWSVLLVGQGDLDLVSLESIIVRYPALAGRISLHVAIDDPADETSDINAQFVSAVSIGDQLGADALLEFALASVLEQSDFFYSDEILEDPATGVKQPWRKPCWSPDLLLSVNYIGGLWFASSELMARAQLTAVSLATLSPYDAVLRLTEMAAGVSSIPAILYARAGVLPETFASQRHALEQAATRKGWVGDLKAGPIVGSWNFKPREPSSDLVSIIIPTCAARDLIYRCIDTIYDRTRYKAFEIISVENIPDSNKSAKEWLRSKADTVVGMTEPFNWARYNNVGAAKAQGKYLLFLNDDIEVEDPAWLETLVGYLNRDGVGIVGPRLLYPDGKVQHAGMFMSGAVGRHFFRFAGRFDPGPFGMALLDRNVSAVTGACMLVARSTFDDVGGFEEAHAIVNNDVDFCLKVGRLGLRVVYTAETTLVHHELGSRGHLEDVYDASLFDARWNSTLALGDPFLNQDLIQDGEFYVPDCEPIEAVFPGSLRRREEISRILCVKLDHIGDFVTAFPAIRALKCAFPLATITALVSRASLDIAHLEPSIDACIEFNLFQARSEDGLRRVEQDEWAALDAHLEDQEFDLAIDLRLHTDTRHVLRRVHGATLAGFDPGGLFPWLDIALPWEGDAQLRAKRTHISSRLLELVTAVELACDAGPLAFTDDSARKTPTSTRLDLSFAGLDPSFLDRPIVCVHPGVGNRMRQWPPAYFSGLIKLLLELENVNVVLIGGPDEKWISDEIMTSVNDPSRLVTLVGKSRLGDLPVLLQVCSLYVGNNSGPKHIAAAMGVPTIGIHSGVVDANEWGPLGMNALAIRKRMTCSPCYLAEPDQCHRGLECLTAIKPRYVYRYCRRLLRLPNKDAGAISAPRERS